MGFGHRVYKNYDPRATVMQQTVREVFKAMKVSDPVFDVALQLEEMALKDDPYFVEKKLFPNVDFYSGVILSAIGFPTSHVHRACSRLPVPSAGWRSGTR